MLQAVIIAGGLATRLRPLTEKIPKSLVDVNGIPFVFYQLKLLNQNGIDRALLCLGYLGEQVVDILGTEKFGVSLSYSFEGKVLLGTAGCLKQALPLLEEHFFVLYGDSYLPCDYSDVEADFFGQKKPALMTVFQNKDCFDTSNVEFQSGKILRYSKTEKKATMQHIDYGLGVFSREVIAALPEGKLDLAEVYQQLLREGKLAAYEVKERFYEVGSFSGIQDLSDYLMRRGGDV